MTTVAPNLLRRLEPPVRAAAASARPERSELQSIAGFDDLLLLASRGELRSGLPVEPAGADSTLSEVDLERLSEAVDTATAAGFEQALILLDRRQLVLDVLARRVVEELSQSESMRTFRVDGAVIAPHRDQQPAPIIGPGGLPPESVREQIESAHRSLRDSLQPDASPRGGASEGST